ncbi:MAG: DUF3299 domain-containing protein [Opitutaceae bacterium]|nr:DUF3299 domain-containing protein [Opitutaceae bacterium]
MNSRPLKSLVVSAVAVCTPAVFLQAALFPSQTLMDHTLCCGTSIKAALHPLNDPPARSALAFAVVAVADSNANASTATAAAVSAPSAKPEIEQEGDYLKIGFDRLSSYTFKVPEFDPEANPNVAPPTGEEQIPGWLKSLNGRKAKVTGFMLPTKLENSLVTEFLLLSDPMMCCYGAVPEMNQWIVVRMKKGGVKPIQDVPVSFYGDLKIGAMFENGYMTGIYLLDCEKMGEVQE